MRQARVSLIELSFPSKVNTLSRIAKWKSFPADGIIGLGGLTVKVHGLRGYAR